MEIVILLLVACFIAPYLMFGGDDGPSDDRSGRGGEGHGIGW